jgi:glycosyltransferase involved in cell wall biosynthesis
VQWSYVAPEPETDIEPGPIPSFSVVIAAYQAAETIAEAVESALSQAIPPLEVIVSDDGSTDDIEGALAPYRQEVTLIRGEHAGAGAARNAAAAIARGDFVSVLDADDAYLPERVEALGKLGALRPDLDILATDAYLEAGGQVVGRFNEQTAFVVGNQRAGILERCFCAWPAMRRSRLLAIEGFDTALSVGQDWDCVVRLILAGSKAGLVNVPLYRYRLGTGSLTANRPEALRDRVLLLEKAQANPDLRPEERELLRRSLAFNRRRALLAEAEDALRSSAPGARRRAFAVTLGEGMDLTTRLKAAAATLAPGLAARRLDAREARTGSSRLKRGVES